MVTSTSQEETYARESCLKLEVGESSSSKESIFVKGTWFPSHFFLLITNGAEAWLCNGILSPFSHTLLFLFPLLSLNFIINSFIFYFLGLI